MLVNFREQYRKQAKLVQAVESPGRGAASHHANDLLQDPRGGPFPDVNFSFPYITFTLSVKIKIEQGGEPYSAEHANRVLAETDPGITDAAYQSVFQIPKPVDIIDDGKIGNIVKESVYRKITSKGILPGCAEGVVRSDRPAITIELGDGPEGRDFDYLPPPEIDVGQAEPPADKAAVSEDLFDLVGVSGGADVEVFGFFPQQEIPDTPAYKVGDMAMAMETIKDLQGVGVDT